MDPDLIYAKTASGEEAMLKRTRVMQRNVRMVLILVDGRSTVADLCAKTGNVQLTENALSELERGGFVESRGEPDSLWAESKKVAEEIRAAAIEQISQFSIPAARKAPVRAEPPVPESRVFVHSVFPIHPRSDPSMSRFSAFAPLPSLRAADDSQLIFDQEETQQSQKEQASRRREKSRPSFVERLKAFSTRERNADVRVSIKPIRRGKHYSTGWPTIAMVGIVSVLALSYLTISFFPYEHYLPDVEAAFSQASERPVKIETMRVVAYPKPGLLLGNVRIGTGEEEIHIAQVRLLPVLGTLATAKATFSEMALSGVTLPAELIGGLPSVFVAAAKSTAKAQVGRVTFEKTEISFGGLSLSGMEGEAKLSADGLFQSLLLRSPDRSLSLEAKPEARRLNVTLEGFAWRPSQGSALMFDSVNLLGNIEDGVFTIRSMELRLFGGLIQGVAVLQADKKPSIFGEVSFDRISATRFGDAVGIGSQLAGETAGKMRFSATADSWAEIFSEIEADGEFTSRRGSVRGIDLAEAMRRVSGAPMQGGVTIFERLTGKIKLTPTSYQFPGLVLSSGLMQSTGYVEVSKDFKLKGKLELRIRGTVNQTRVPISLSGSLKAPIVQVGSG